MKVTKVGAVIAIAASANCEKLTQEIFGGEMDYVKWMRPGFELGLAGWSFDPPTAMTKYAYTQFAQGGDHELGVLAL